jgi:hypothetical protein
MSGALDRSWGGLPSLRDVDTLRQGHAASALANQASQKCALDIVIQFTLLP